jgi:hypothetical protein
MPDTIAVAIISAVSALAGVAISQTFEYLKRKSEETRWYADYFLPKKFDSISNLYAQLQTVHGALTIYHVRKIENKVELEVKVVSVFNSFLHKYHLANIYLPESVNSSIGQYIKYATEAALYIDSKLEPIVYITDGHPTNVVVDWPEELANKYEDTRKKLAKVLTPTFLAELEKRWNKEK